MSVVQHWSAWPSRNPKLDPDGYVYVLEFSLHVVKVGRTNGPKMRARSHESAVARFDGTMTRWWLSPLHREWKANERLLITTASERGRQLGSVEYYADCSFDEMVAVGAALDMQPSSPSVAGVATHPVELCERIRAAWETQASNPSGRAGWEALCAAEFADLRATRWQPAVRGEMVRSLRTFGMSHWAITRALGISMGSVNRDSFQVDYANAPQRVTGLDGRNMPARSAEIFS